MLLKNILFFILLTALCHASTQDDQSIQEIHQKIHQAKPSTMADRIALISQAWLGKPYLLFSLGEGQNGQYSQRPLYRSDAFDCETMVDTSLALAWSDDLRTFQNHINRIRYYGETPDFLERKHFISLDWNPNNQAKGYIRNYSSAIAPVVYAEAIIDKGNWLKHISAQHLYLPHAKEPDIAQRLEHLKTIGDQYPPKKVRFDYIPLSALFDEHQAPKMELFNKIPSGAIIEIVRPNWHLKEVIGTNLHVSHLGFAIRHDGILWFRNASSIHHQVLDEVLVDYLKKYLHHPTIKGIHIELVNETQQHPILLDTHHQLYLEYAKTDAQRRQGLMWRKELTQDSGMLFFFPYAHTWTIWMKNTWIPLDIIWLNAQHQIIDYQDLAPPCYEKNCPIYRPSSPAVYVLELNAGQRKGLGLKKGQIINFK